MKAIQPTQTKKTDKENVSKVFLLPGIGIKDELKQKFNLFGFVNTYLTAEPLQYPYHVIFLLFRPQSLDMDFNNFVTDLQKNPNFIEVIDLIDGEVLLVYRVPKKFNIDYELFLQGKYSKLSSAFKSCFAMEKIKFEKGKPVKENGRFVKENTNFYHIFNRTDYIKNVIKEKYNLDDDTVESIEEFYDRQDPLRESLAINPENIW